jgi:DNA-binding LacI/PurR family transcriptional regulator/DNA-binding transcriptional regulator YhcF (GntR family)
MATAGMGPAVRKAVDFLTVRLESGVWQEGERMPSIRRLAEMSGYSFNTVLEAVRHLKSEGRVTAVARSGLRAGTRATAPEATVETAGWRSKRAELERDILSGVYAPRGGLPSMKELQVRYGACYATMRKILRSMAEDGVVELRNRRYEIRSLVGRSPSTRLVFVAYRIQETPHSALNQGQYYVLNLLEQECIRRRIELDIVEVDFYNLSETQRVAAGSEISAPALGYIFDVWWYGGDEFREANMALLSRLVQLRRPVAILDELGEFVLPARFAANPFIQVFCIQGKTAGARIARHLLNMGHTTVAYLSNQHDTSWSMQRLAGITEQYAHAGLDEQVHPFVNNSTSGALEQLLTITGFDDDLVRRIVAIDRTESQAEDEFALYRQFKETHPPPGPETEPLRHNLAGIVDLARRNPDKEFFDTMTLSALMLAGMRLSEMALIPLLEQALSRRECTAWICGTDTLAFLALTFLSSRGVEVPRGLSVASFDNNPLRAPRQRLTTFDFNAHGFIHHMLDFVLRPHRKRGPHQHRVIEIEGVVMQRGTVAPLKGKGAG